MTSEEEKRLLILAAVTKLGGSATKKETLDAIVEGDLMKLSAYDLEKRKSRNELNWRNDLAFIRDHLVRDGHLTSEWNTWAITKSGRQHLSSLANIAAAQQDFQHIKPDALPLIGQMVGTQDVLDEAALTGESIFSEGEQTLHWNTSYERNKSLRSEAIRIHGTTCMACTFDFSARYGVIGNGFIEVHHTKPISSFAGVTQVNPQTDLVVLCSNCHSIVHRHKGEPLSVKALRETLNQRA